MRILLSCLFSLPFLILFAENKAKEEIAKTTKVENTSNAKIEVKPAIPFEQFTGKVMANKVRLRTTGDLQSPIVRELCKNEYLLILGERNDFYEVAIPSDIKLFVFSLYIKDNHAEANRVNIRLMPSLESPIVGQLQQSEKVEGSPVANSPKWMEILPPKHLHFYVSKEYIEKMGGPEIFVTFEKRKTEAQKLLTSANLLIQEELKKSKELQSFTSILPLYETLTKEYSDVSDVATQAKEQLQKFGQPIATSIVTPVVKEEKLALPSTSSTAEMQAKSTSNSDENNEKDSNEPFSKMFQALEEELFLSWNSFHPSKTQKDYYEEQVLNCQTLSGTVELLNLDVKNAPGNYVLKSEGKIIAYLYSTKIDLKDSLGKKIQVSVSSRPNNSFAYPAYFVHEIR